MNTVLRLNFRLFRRQHGIYVYDYNYDNFAIDDDADDNVLEVVDIEFDNDVDSDVDDDVEDGCAGVGV
jgi:hypothetical protein